MSTVPAAQQAASQYIHSLPGTVGQLRLVGMTQTANGRRLGFEVEWDEGRSLAGGFLGGLFFGLVGLLVAVLLALPLVLVGTPPSLLILLALVIGGGAAVVGARAGADASEVENLTVTVDARGDVVMVNRELSAGEFSRSIDRQYDRQSQQVDDIAGTLSKHWVFHKLLDHWLDSRKKN